MVKLYVKIWWSVEIILWYYRKGEIIRLIWNFIKYVFGNENEDRMKSNSL